MLVSCLPPRNASAVVVVVVVAPVQESAGVDFLPCFYVVVCQLTSGTLFCYFPHEMGIKHLEIVLEQPAM
jgi:hypothetical protein